jgi:hypothetical protein
VFTNGEMLTAVQKYTVQSTGIWEVIRRTLAVSPERSNGVPLNAQFRNPTPGSNPPGEYEDPVTAPAGDIAENPYWKRDVRRAYARTSTMSQADIVGLLTVGSAAKPTQELIGEAGAKALVAATKDGEERGLAAFFAGDSKSLAAVADTDGLPPMPPGLNHGVTAKGLGEKDYELMEDQTYGNDTYVYVERDVF